MCQGDVYEQSSQKARTTPRLQKISTKICISGPFSDRSTGKRLSCLFIRNLQQGSVTQALFVVHAWSSIPTLGSIILRLHELLSSSCSSSELESSRTDPAGVAAFTPGILAPHTGESEIETIFCFDFWRAGAETGGTPLAGCRADNSLPAAPSDGRTTAVTALLCSNYQVDRTGSRTRPLESVSLRVYGERWGHCQSCDCPYCCQDELCPWSQAEWQSASWLSWPGNHVIVDHKEK